MSVTEVPKLPGAIKQIRKKRGSVDYSRVVTSQKFDASASDSEHLRWWASDTGLFWWSDSKVGLTWDQAVSWAAIVNAYYPCRIMEHLK